MLITGAAYSAGGFQQITRDTIPKVSADTLDADEGEPLSSKIIYNARDSIRYEHGNKRVLLFGAAYVEYENTSMKAEYIIIDNKTSMIKAYGKLDSLGKPVGNPHFKNGEEELVMDTIKYNPVTKKGKMYNVQTRQAGMLVLGSEIKKDSNNVVYMKNLKCLPCDFADSRTMFRATKAKIIPDDKIVTGPMYLEVGGVPTPIALPFGFFPNSRRRHSGILIPFYGNSEERGFYLKDGGFYWGISDQTDMIIRGDIYSGGSWGLRTLNNYNVLYKYNGSVALGYSLYKAGEKEIPSTQSKVPSYNFTWQHNQDNKNNPNVRFSSNVNVVLGNYNTYNALNSGQFLSSSFNSNISFTRMFKNSVLGINARHTQNTIDSTMSITFPELTYSVNRFYPFKRQSATRQNMLDKLSISYRLDAKAIRSGKERNILKGNLGDSINYGFQHTVPIQTNVTLFKYFTLTPSINMSAVMYTNTTRHIWDPVGKKQVIDNYTPGFRTGVDANFNTSLTTKLYMDYLFRSKRLKQIRHVLIPTINYMFRPDYGEAVYGIWKDVQIDTVGRMGRYSIYEKGIFGGPAQGKQNSLSFNLNNNIEAKVRQKTDSGYTFNKVTIIQGLGINGGYNFAADSFQMSNFTATMRTTLWKFIGFNTDATLDPYGYDGIANRRVKTYALNQNGTLARFTTGNVAVNASFGSNTKMVLLKKKNPDPTNGAEQGAPKTDTEQERLPWNLNLAYNIRWTRDPNDHQKLKDVQTFNFNGDIKVTKYWKVGMTSGYDFTNHGISYTSLNIYRDLHCWEARVSWVPFGFNKSYSVSINLKSSMLSDIKPQRQRAWYDN